MAQDITRTLAQYVAHSSIDDIPKAVVHEATRALLNWFACALGGCRHDTIERAFAALGQYGGTADVTLLGRGTRSGLLFGTLINGMSGHVLDFDDAQLRATNINPSSAVAPVAACLGEKLRASGPQVLHAFILGLEVECRIANAVFASGSKRWFANSVTGVVGAAACASKLLQLDGERTTHALGIAAAQASGLRVVFGTMSKSLVVGHAAENGLQAALLARQGFTCSAHSIEAPLGYAQVFSPGCEPALILKNLGNTYELSYFSYKPFACGIVLHAAIDACIRARNNTYLDPSAIHSVALRVHPAVLEVTGNRTPQCGLESKFSVFHAVAVALINGTAGEKEFSDERVADADIVALRARVQAQADATLQRDQAHVRLELKDGRIVEQDVEHALGSLRNPLADKNLEEKLIALASDVLDRKVIDRLITLFWSLADLDDFAVVPMTAMSK